VRAYVKFTVIYRHKEKYTISEMCKFLSVSRSGYYDYVKRMDIPAKDLPLAEKIRECQEKCGRTYGYRRVHIWLERNGIYHNPKTILRVMQKYNLLSVVRRKIHPGRMAVSRWLQRCLYVRKCWLRHGRAHDERIDG